MLTPGAHRLSGLPLFENEATPSALSVAPTLIAVEMHAGAPIPVVKPLFPAAIIVAVPADASWSMSALRSPSGVDMMRL